MTGCRVGTVCGLGRYPVKSMLGEHPDAFELDRRGVLGDRLYAVRDGAGKFGSGKTTRRFRYIAGLFGFHAAYGASDWIPVVTFPDGCALRGDDPTIDARLSEFLAVPVSLTRETVVSHFDAGPVHLVTTASLRAVGDILPSGEDARRFRPNIVVDTNGGGFEEDRWVGRALVLGGGTRLRITGRTERCGMVGFAQEELDPDPRILRSVVEANATCLGVYAEVLDPGAVRLGDPVCLV